MELRVLKSLIIILAILLITYIVFIAIMRRGWIPLA